MGLLIGQGVTAGGRELALGLRGASKLGLGFVVVAWLLSLRLGSAAPVASPAGSTGD